VRKIRLQKGLCVRCGAPRPGWREIDPNAPSVRGRFKGYVCNKCFSASQAGYASPAGMEAMLFRERVREAIGKEKLERIKALAGEIGDTIGLPALSDEEVDARRRANRCGDFQRCA
jgi:hypothetical protein